VRAARGDSRPFCCERYDPLGINAILQRVSILTEAPPSGSSLGDTLDHT
jgi:hypothetical protein